MSPLRPHIGFLAQRMLLGFGVDMVVDRQARGLRALGYPVTVYAHQVGDQYRQAPYEVVSLAEKVNDQVTFVDPIFRQDAIPFLRGQDVEAWVIHTPPFFDWVEELDAPAIHYEHGTPDGRFFPRQRGLDLDWETRCRHEHVFNRIPNTQAVVAISEFIRSGFPEPIRTHAAVIPNGADHYAEASDEDARRLRRDLGVQAGEVLVLYVSRIVFEGDDQPYKGVHDLLADWPGLARRNPRMRLVLAGRGREEDARRLTAMGVIPFLNVPVERMAVLHRSADLYACPSRWEGFNLPVVEAQYQGTPVLAYRLAAHPEVVDPGGGTLASSRREWRRALLRLAGDPEDLRRRGEEARQWVRAFSWHRNVQSLEGLLQAVCGIARGDPDPRPLTERVGQGPDRTWRRTWLILRRVHRDQGWRGLLALGRGSS